MAKIFKPRRGSSSVMSSTKANTVLASGEIFFETPNGGIGTGEGAGIKMGDGTTAYSSLPYFIKPVDVSTAAVTVTTDSSATSTAALNNVSTGASTGSLIGSLKQAISLTKSELTSTIDDGAANLNVYVGEDGLIHFTDWVGADSVLPFSSGFAVTKVGSVNGAATTTIAVNDTYTEYTSLTVNDFWLKPTKISAYGWGKGSGGSGSASANVTMTYTASTGSLVVKGCYCEGLGYDNGSVDGRGRAYLYGDVYVIK